jgi:hypothetical protein
MNHPVDRQRRVALYHLGEIRSVDIQHGHIPHPLVVAEVIDLEDVGMAEVAGEENLASHLAWLVGRPAEPKPFESLTTMPPANNTSGYSTDESA